jgi:hypothetical protein
VHPDKPKMIPEPWWKRWMVEPRDRDLACQTEAYAEAGHYGATVVSPGFKSSYGNLHVLVFVTFIFNT